ncbi:MAG TPA: hypothetical protein DCY25_01630 [Bacteroidales bacterium]|nr:hypothetical protein [Bacteroidales bacterium]
MQMMKTKVILSVIFTLIAADLAAQNSQVLYFMDLPQNHLVNPAFRPSNRIYVGLPGISGVDVTVKNNIFSFSDFLPEGREINEATIPFLNSDFDTEGFMNGLKERNYFEPKAMVQLLGVGFSPQIDNDLYMFLDINDHVSGGMVLPRDFFRLVFEGNENLAGQSFDLSETRMNAMYYREIGVGASKNLTPRLRFGAKARALFGMAAANLRNYGLNLIVNEDYTNSLEANMALNISGPVNVVTDDQGHIEDVDIDDDRFNDGREIRRFLTNTRNAGFGLDLGAEFAATGRLTLSAAITDVGFIKWTSDLSNLETTGNIMLSGLDLQDVYNSTATFDDITGSLIDSLKNSLVATNDPTRFTTKLPVGFTAGGKYDINEKFSVGLLSYTQISDQQIKEAVTLSGNMNLGNTLTATLAYTACNHTYDNLGLGIGVRASVFQFYFLCDRVPLNWKRTGGSGEEIFLPAGWNTLHARLGMNLVFGNRGNDNY